MEKVSKIGLWLTVVFTLTELAACIITIANGKYIVGSVVNVFIICCIIYYAAIGYKKPHGNLLKMIMLLFDVSLIFFNNAAIKFGNETVVAMIPILMVVIGYVSGRLNRFKENAILMSAVFAGFLHCSLSSIIKSGGNLGFATNHVILYPLAIWAVLCGAYFTRFKEHKEAGLEDRK